MKGEARFIYVFDFYSSRRLRRPIAAPPPPGSGTPAAWRPAARGAPGTSRRHSNPPATEPNSSRPPSCPCGRYVLSRQKSSLLIHNSPFSIKISSFSIDNSSFLMQNSTMAFLPTQCMNAVTSSGRSYLKSQNNRPFFSRKSSFFRRDSTLSPHFRSKIPKQAGIILQFVHADVTQPREIQAPVFTQRISVFQSKSIILSVGKSSFSVKTRQISAFFNRKPPSCEPKTVVCSSKNRRFR